MPFWTVDDTWIVIIGSLCAIACALPGTFLVLRQMGMMGDAISHAVLPGLALAYIISGSRHSFIMFLGAATVGLATAFFSQWIARLSTVDRGAAMGIVFTSLFAIGLLLIVQAADHVDLDPSCVLFGAIEFAPLDTLASISLGSHLINIPAAATSLAAIAALSLVTITLFFKELALCSFDPGHARSIGINEQWIHYLLMMLVALATVASFEAVGSIIVIAMLVVPPSCAILLSNKLPVILFLSALFGIAAAAIGHLGALSIPPLLGFPGTSTAGMMAVAAGFLFAVCWLYSALLARRARHPRPDASPP